MAEEVSPSDQRRARVLQFAPFQSMVDEGFWRRLCSLKLDKLGLNDAPIDITGFYAPSTHIHVPQHLTLLAESLPSKSSNTAADEAIIGNRNRCPVPGTIYNTNTLESFHALEKGSILKAEAGKIWRDILSGKAEKDPSLLSRFLLISFADLKRWKFYYWFAFPALALDPPATLTKLEPASSFFTSAEGESLSAACKEWRDSSITSSVPFFFIAISPDSHATLRPLQDFEDYQHNAKKLLFGFYDPCHLPNFPGWPLRNFLTFIGIRWKLDKICFFCYRESRGVPDLSVSLIGEAMISIPDWSEPEHTPKAVGWEQNKGKLTSRCISLAQSMDPNRLAISAADLNLKLMRWRMLPSLNLDILSSLKCLLFGAGTLGCQVARMLMAWGVRKITLVDNGRVAMSNPLRQSLYTFDNCLNGGDLKAIAAAKSLKCIFPAAEAEGVSLSIPMPGHPVSSQETASVLEDCKHLETLVASHDAIFLLTDTRESRWLPTLLCANFDKITITSALGFDNYLVMRHGAGPRINNSNMTEFTETVSSARSKDGNPRLGCYFCNDVVAPIDSTSNRTLDQQCTVTRPGLAPIASSIAVELLVGILHHPEGTNAQGEIANSIIDENDKPLGILPHQIRGSLSQFSQLTLVGYSSDSCTACSPLVVSEYRRRGLDFVLEAINQPTYLEKITGLTELMNSVSIADLDWDDEVDYDA